MADYYPVIQSILKGKRRWTVTLYGLYESASDAPGEVYETQVHRDVSVEWGEKSEVDAPWLPSIARLKLRDPNQTIYQFLTNRDTDRDVRSLIHSEDGQYRWEGFVRLKTLDTYLARWLRVPVADVYAYDGLGQVDELIGSLLASEVEAKSLAGLLKYVLLRLADLPIRYLHGLDFTGRLGSDIGLLNHLFSPALAGQTEWQDRFRDIAKRFGLRIFQDMRVQPGQQLNAWHVAQMNMLHQDQPASGKYSLRFEHFEDSEDTLEAAAWTAERVQVGRQQLTGDDKASKHAGLSRLSYSFDWSDAPAPPQGEESDVTTGGILQNHQAELFDGLGNQTAWGGEALGASSKSYVEGGTSIRIEPHGHVMQQPTPVTAGEKLQFVTEVRLAMEFASTEADETIARAPRVAYFIRTPGGDKWYYNQDHGWLKEGGDITTPQALRLEAEIPNEPGASLDWYTYKVPGTTHVGLYNTAPTPVSGWFEVRFLPPQREETTLYVDEANVRLLQDPQTSGEGDTAESWKGALQHSGSEGFSASGAEYEVETVLHPGRLSSLYYWDEATQTRRPVGLFTTPEDSTPLPLYRRRERQLNTIHEAGWKRPSLHVPRVVTPSTALASRLEVLNSWPPAEGDEGTTFMPLTCKLNLRTERTEVEAVPVARDLSQPDTDWKQPAAINQQA